MPILKTFRTIFFKDLLNDPRTSLAGVVDEDDLLEQRPRRSVDDAPDGPQERGPGFVVENDDY